MKRRPRFRGSRPSGEERLQLRRLAAEGSTYAEAGGAMRRSKNTVRRLIGSTGGLRPRNRPRSALRLSGSPALRRRTRGDLPRTSSRVVASECRRPHRPVCLSERVSAGRPAASGPLPGDAWRVGESACRRVEPPSSPKTLTTPPSLALRRSGRRVEQHGLLPPHPRRNPSLRPHGARRSPRRDRCATPADWGVPRQNPSAPGIGELG
jgi:hypothetical protein